MKVKIVSIEPAQDNRSIRVNIKWEMAHSIGYDYVLVGHDQDIEEVIAQEMSRRHGVEEKVEQAQTLVGRELEV